MNDISRVETYKSLAGQTELALFQINSDHQLTFTSQPFEHLLNWGEGELEGHLVSELAHPENVRDLPELLNNACLPEQESAATITIKFQHKSKGWIPCELHCIAVDKATVHKTFLVTTASASDPTDDQVIIELTQMLCRQHCLAAVIDEASNSYLWTSQNYLDLIGMTLTELNELYQQGGQEQPLLTPESQQTATTLKALLIQIPAIKNQMISFADQRGARQELSFNTLSCNLRSKTYIIGDSIESTLPNSEIKAASKTARGDIVESMVGDIAYSFNNLLSIVSGHTAILQESADLESNASFESIHQAVADGATLIKQLNRLTVTKPDQAETLNLGQYIEQMQVMIKLAIGRSISLSMVNNNGNWQCSINPAEYEYALIKLCLNAKETLPAGGTLSITIEQVSQQSKDIKTYGLMAAEYTKLAIVVSGSDSSEEIAKLIFNPFLSILDDPSTHTEEITSQNSNASAIDAVFLITLDEGDGARLNGFIPRYKSIEDAPGSDHDPIVFESKIKRALLLEDDQGVRELVSMFLQGQGFDVTEVESEMEVDLLEDLNFDFMVSDVMLPGKAMGPEVVQKIRTTNKNLPALFISGYSHGSLSSEDLNKPNTDFLAKPFSKADFITKLEQLLA